jgi:serine/threonine protein kinase
MLAKALEGTLARQVTQPGQLMGDVPYMSPERTRDPQGVDHRSDIYGLGATLYALLTGRPPFESDSLPELIHQVRQAEPEKPKEFQLSINDLFQDVVLKMIAKRAAERFQTPAEMLRELQRIGRYNNLEADWSGWSDGLS